MTVSPGILNLTFPQGSTWTLGMTWQDGDGEPLSLVDYLARMQMRTGYEAPTPTLSLTNGTGITLGGTAGTIDLLVGATTTAGIPAATYVYDLELEAPTGQVTRLVQGSLTVTPEVTR
jgi:hypothetical protein